MQVNALDPWICGPKFTSVSCPHEWVIVRLCDESSRLNIVSEPKVVPGMMWVTCKGGVFEIPSHLKQDPTSIK